MNLILVDFSGGAMTRAPTNLIWPGAGGPGAGAPGPGPGAQGQFYRLVMFGQRCQRRLSQVTGVGTQNLSF